MSVGQEEFDKACVEYDRAVEIIKEMSQWVKKAKPDFSEKIALTEFDYILQDLLIEIAFSDGDFAYVESQFIDKITDHGDVLAYIRNKTGLNVNWNNIRQVRDDKVREFLDLIDENLDSRCNDFVLCFAALDALLEEQKYYDRLQKAIVSIAVHLAKADGHADKVEAEATAYKFAKLIAIRWEIIKAKAKEMGDSQDDAAHPGSLKEKYLKKKN